MTHAGFLRRRGGPEVAPVNHFCHAFGVGGPLARAHFPDRWLRLNGGLRLNTTPRVGAAGSRQHSGTIRCSTWNTYPRSTSAARRAREDAGGGSRFGSPAVREFVFQPPVDTGGSKSIGDMSGRSVERSSQSDGTDQALPSFLTAVAQTRQAAFIEFARSSASEAHRPAWGGDHAMA